MHVLTAVRIQIFRNPQTTEALSSPWTTRMRTRLQVIDGPLAIGIVNLHGGKIASQQKILQGSSLTFQRNWEQGVVFAKGHSDMMNSASVLWICDEIMRSLIKQILDALPFPVPRSQPSLKVWTYLYFIYSNNIQHNKRRHYSCLSYLLASHKAKTPPQN